MQKLPQTVRERLKPGSAVAAHPDADILTAFAERSLLEPERAHVLAHLSTCGDCREILALALPAIDTGTVTPVSVAVRRSWVTWPAFRWGFATAGVALIGLGVAEFEHLRPTHSATVAKQVLPVAVVTEMKKEQAVPAGAALAAPQNASGKSTSIKKKDLSSLAKTERRLLSNEPQPHSLNQALPSPPAFVAEQQKPNASGQTAQSEMVEVQVQSQPVNAQTADSHIAKSSPANGTAEQFFGYNSGPLSRAKPADIEPIQGGAAGGKLATPRWSITGVGSLQRSFDQGRTWQDVSVDASTPAGVSGTPTGVGGPMKAAAAKQTSMSAPMAAKVSGTPTFFRAVTAAGNEVWAGGSNAALFHSTDGGDHWTRILPSFSNAMLTGDIVTVEFSDPQHGTVTTSTPEIWITTDDGQTWQKQ